MISKPNYFRDFNYSEGIIYTYEYFFRLVMYALSHKYLQRLWGAKPKGLGLAELVSKMWRKEIV